MRYKFQFFFVHLQRIEIYGVLPWLDHNSQPKTEDKETRDRAGVVLSAHMSFWYQEVRAKAVTVAKASFTDVGSSPM